MTLFEHSGKNCELQLCKVFFNGVAILVHPYNTRDNAIRKTHGDVNDR